jgi:hypothetical protein
MQGDLYGIAVNQKMAFFSVYISYNGYAEILLMECSGRKSRCSVQ